MKERILNNLSLKLLSVLIAVVIWLIVVNYDNPYTTRTISNIPIEIVNEDTLVSKNMIYSVMANPTASVRVRCPRKTTESLRASDFKAVADLNDLYAITNQVPVTITCSHSRVTSDEITLLTPSLQIEIETIETKQMEVRSVLTGDPSRGYQVGDVICSPSVVTVSAPQSFLDRISFVGVEIDVNNISRTMNQSAPLQFFSAGGNPMDVSQVEHLSVSSSEIDVEVEILNVKSVNINYTVTGQENVADGYLYAGIELSKESVEISGRRSDLAEISSLELPVGSLDVSGANANIEKSFDLRELLPEGTSLVNPDDAMLDVTMRIEKQLTKEYILPVSKMQIENLGENLYVANEDEKATVVVMGLGSDLAALSEDEIEVVLNLSGMRAGMHTILLDVKVPHGFSVVGTPRVLLHLEDTENIANNMAENGAAGQIEDENRMNPVNN